MSKEEIVEFLMIKKGYAYWNPKRVIKLLKDNGNDIKVDAEEMYLILKDVRDKIRGVATRLTPAHQKLRIMVYDIETTLNLAEVWSSGEQYVGHKQLRTETQIITVAWKWLGDEKVNYLYWNDGCDKELMEEFLKEFNKAYMLIGQNNMSFDDKMIRARALKHRLFVNKFTKSYDIMRQLKDAVRLPSYSMAYVSKFLGLKGKFNYGGGLEMWEDIQWGTEEEKAAAIKMMIKYNKQDVVTTEEMFVALRPYLKGVSHLGVMTGGKKSDCPHCGSEGEYTGKVVTEAGTIQRTMKCPSCSVQYKISNTDYLKTL